MINTTSSPINPFLFKGFEPGPELSVASNILLGAALKIAPKDSISFGYIMKDGDVYRGHLENPI